MPESKAKKALEIAPRRLGASERYLLIVISLIAVRGTKKTTRAELAKLSGLSPNTITRALGKLERTGLIDRQRESLGRIGSYILLTLKLDQYVRRERREAEMRWKQSQTARSAAPQKPQVRLKRTRPDPGPFLPFDALPPQRKNARKSS